MKKLTINPTGKKESASSMDRVKTFEDACQVLGLDQSELTVSGVLEEDFESISAYAKLIIINKALNEGWKPNWADDDEYKYYLWFDLSSGSGLRFDVYGCPLSLSLVLLSTLRQEQPHHCQFAYRHSSFEAV